MTRRRLVRALLLLVLAAVAGYPLVRYLLLPAEAREAAVGLRSSAVFVPAGGEEVLDAERVRAVVGDRPIVVAVLAASYRGKVLHGCRAVARQQPRNLVLTYQSSRPGSYPAICAGADFPEPDVPEPRTDILGDRTDLWLLGLSRAAQQASQFRVSPASVDRTPEIEELVLAFDAQVVQDYPAGLPRRVASPAPQTLARVLAQLLGLVVLLLLGFALVRLAARRLSRALDARRERQDRRAVLDAALSEVSAELLTGRPRTKAEAARRADVAELYLHALTAFEAARGSRRLHEAERAVERVRAAAGTSG